MTRYEHLTGAALPSLAHRRYVTAMCYTYKEIVQRRGAECAATSSFWQPASPLPARRNHRSGSAAHGYQLDVSPTKNVQLNQPPGGRRMYKDTDQFMRVRETAIRWNALLAGFFKHGAAYFKKLIKNSGVCWMYFCVYQ